jgi:hypothetical protein
LYAPDLVVAFILKNNSDFDNWNNIIVIYNPYYENKLVYIPDGEWQLFVNGNEFFDNSEINNTHTNQIEVKGLSMTILYEV